MTGPHIAGTVGDLARANARAILSGAAGRLLAVQVHGQAVDATATWGDLDRRHHGGNQGTALFDGQ
jgi:hypothetical protein